MTRARARGENIYYVGKKKCGSIRFSFQTETPSWLFSRIFPRISFFQRKERNISFFGHWAPSFFPFCCTWYIPGNCRWYPPFPPSCKVKGEEKKRKKKNLWHPFFFFFFRTSKKRKKPSSSSSQKDKQMLERGRTRYKIRQSFSQACFSQSCLQIAVDNFTMVFLSTFLFFFSRPVGKFPSWTLLKVGLESKQGSTRCISQRRRGLNAEAGEAKVNSNLSRGKENSKPHIIKRGYTQNASLAVNNNNNGSTRGACMR